MFYFNHYNANGSFRVKSNNMCEIKKVHVSEIYQSRARYLSVREAPHNTNFHTWMGKKHFCFFETAETGNRTPNSGVKGGGANHYPRAPAHGGCNDPFYTWGGGRPRYATKITAVFQVCFQMPLYNPCIQWIITATMFIELLSFFWKTCSKYHVSE